MPRRLLFLLLLALHVTPLARAQTAQSTTAALPPPTAPPAYAQIDTRFRTYVNQVFGALETQRVPTGLLLDYGFDVANPRLYNGTLLADSTLMEPGVYADLYKTLFTSRVNDQAAGLRHPSLHDSLCYQAREREVITLSGLLFRYSATT